MLTYLSNMLSINVYPVTVLVCCACYVINVFLPGFNITPVRKGKLIQDLNKEWFMVTTIGLIIGLLVGYVGFMLKLVFTPIIGACSFLFITSLYSDCLYRRVDRFVLRFIILFSVLWCCVFYWTLIPYIILGLICCCGLFFVEKIGQSDVRTITILTIFVATNSMNIVLFTGIISLIMGVVVLLSLTRKYSHLWDSLPLVPILVFPLVFSSFFI